MPLPSRNIVMYVAGQASGGGGGSPRRPPVIVEALPEIGEYGVTYLVANGGTAPNLYDEYIWVSPEAGYELLGQKEVDLSHYVRDTRTVNGHALTANVEVTYAGLQDKPSINGVTLSGNKAAADLGLVREVTGKQLSTEDYTTAEKTKLAGIEDGANKSTLLSFTADYIPSLFGYEDMVTVLDADFYAQSGTVIGVQVDIPSATAYPCEYKYQGRLAMLSQVQVTIELFYDNSNSVFERWKLQFDGGKHTLNLSRLVTVDSDGNHNLKLKVSCTRGSFNIDYPYLTMLISGAKAATA